LTQQHELTAPSENMNYPLARYAVTIKVTVETLSADAATVRGFLNDVFAPSEHKVGKVHGANTEPPSDETWLRAIDCAGALG
jgi:hypothetical protein